MYASNNPIAFLDYYGLSKESCDDIVRIALSSKFVMDLIKDGCLTNINCECCPGDIGGYHAPKGPGKGADIKLCWKNEEDGELSDDKMKQNLLHELSHAESQCGEGIDNCKRCMREEKKAYWRAKQCASNDDCTDLAWGSCWYRYYCHGGKQENSRRKTRKL
jgi:hypothetical protein